MRTISEEFMSVAISSMHLVRAHMRAETGSSLTIPQFRVLAGIFNNNSHICSLAEQIGVSQPAISRIIENLVNKKMVTRTTDSLDRRSSILKLTKKGENTFQDIKEKARIKIEKKMTDFKPDELEKIKQSLSCIKNFIHQISDTKK